MGKPRRDLTKEGPFGRLTPIEYIGGMKGKPPSYRCLCTCGREAVVTGSNLTKPVESTKSCGCLQSENATRNARKYGGHNKTHGLAGTPEYNSWLGMMLRCTRLDNPSYRYYGGRGIKVCRRWESFENFLGDMGSRPDGTTLDREDNDGDYEPGNCRWATRKQQSLNRRSNVRVAHDGETLTVSEWSERLGIRRETLRYRIKVGLWPQKSPSRP